MMQRLSHELQNGVLSVLPFLATWIGKLVFATVGGWAQTRLGVGAERVCKITNTYGGELFAKQYSMVDAESLNVFASFRLFCLSESRE